MFAADPTVQLSPSASLKGKIVYAKKCTKPVYTFLGVPYAQPPLGEGRFSPPKTLSLWEGERQAKEFGPTCLQKESHFLDASDSVYPLKDKAPAKMSEDCLYLNVWTPDMNSTAKLPVMLWIHGGVFNYGNSNYYQGVSLASHQHVLFVSFNYRLAALGFMTNATPEAPGNYGLLDQIEALKWVQKYISNFGGDPDNVTIFGESAGGMSCSILVMCEAAKGLFRRAICQSMWRHQATTMVAPQADLKEYLLKLLTPRGCNLKSDSEIVQCLRGHTADFLVEQLGDLHRPVIDGEVIKDETMKLYASYNPDVEMMLGCNSHEGYIFVELIAKMIPGLTIEAFNDFNGAKGYIQQTFAWDCRVADVDGATAAAVQEYLKEGGEGDAIIQGVQEFCGDVLVFTATDQVAKCHSRLCPTYLYYFTQRPSYSQSPAWIQADHFSEVYYVLGLPEDSIFAFTEEEEDFHQMMMQYWANFARTGNPNGEGMVEWPRFTEAQERYLELSKQPKVAEKLKPNRANFWQNIFPKFLK